MWQYKRVLWLVLGVTIAVYLPSVLTHEFVSYDDGLLITQNPRVTTMSMRMLWSIVTSYDPELYVPLTLLTYKLEYAFFGAWPVIYHLTNLLLHLAAVYFVAEVCRLLAKVHTDEDTASWIGVISAALFALHPLNAETVLWASARKDLLSTLFFLWAYTAYLQRERSSGKELLLFAAALVSKISVVLYPLVLVLTDWYTGKGITKETLREKIPHALLMVLFGGIALYGKRYQLDPLSFWQQLGLGAKSTLFYLQEFFWPFHLSVLHPQQYPFSLQRMDMLMPIILLSAVVVAALLVRKRFPTLFFCIGVFACMLLPSISTFWRNGWVIFASERYVYPAAFALLFGGFVFLSRFSALRNRNSLITIMSALLLVCAGGTYVHARSWSDSVALYQQVLSIYPTSTQALNNLGTTLYEEGDVEGALEQYDRALAIDPNLPQVHSNRGAALLKLGRRSEALQAFQHGIDAVSRPDVAYATGMPYLFLAREMDNAGNSDAVLSLLQQAAEIDPRNEEVLYNLAIQEQKREDYPAAAAHFQAAARAEVFRIDALYRYAAVEAVQGHIAEAIDALERVQRLSPGYENTERHLSALRAMEK